MLLTGTGCQVNLVVTKTKRIRCLIKERSKWYGGNAKCRRKLANITRKHKNIIPTLLVIMVKQQSTTKLDNTRKLLTMRIWRGRTQFTLEFTLKRRPKRTTKSTAINHSFSERAPLSQFG